MKTTLLFLAVFMSAFIFQSCDNDDDNIRVDQVIEEAFNAKYPTATRVEWEQEGYYFVAEFWMNNNESSAWFDYGATWLLTETDLSYEKLPEAVKNSFSTGEYQNWRIDDIDMIERPDMETMYVLEVEQGNQEYDLFYTPEGVLTKAVIDSEDNHDEYLPSALPESITNFLNSNYPQARIVEAELERGKIEVDIIDGTILRELLFETSGEWISTKTEVQASQVPPVVMDALIGSEYASYRIDDIDYFETPAKNFYRFELESGSTEVYVNITLDGGIEVQ
ncbi:PepSY-like domain-containing protein [Odoribacter sp. OttesenSCG-928-J03]|nr:PepSY-like domain-containing protein [Odoribacter sp. OttesenSCG-928-J03]MDL2283243.1 PepSY-like domain-containing protein [Odoribacter sp. OttesenSCG-928-G04]